MDNIINPIRAALAPDADADARAAGVAASRAVLAALEAVPGHAIAATPVPRRAFCAAGRNDRLCASVSSARPAPRSRDREASSGTARRRGGRACSAAEVPVHPEHTPRRPCEEAMIGRIDDDDLERSHELERRLDRDFEREPCGTRPRRGSRPRYFSGLMFRLVTVRYSNRGREKRHDDGRATRRRRAFAVPDDDRGSRVPAVPIVVGGPEPQAARRAPACRPSRACRPLPENRSRSVCANGLVGYDCRRTARCTWKWTCS